MMLDHCRLYGSHPAIRTTVDHTEIRKLRALDISVNRSLSGNDLPDLSDLSDPSDLSDLSDIYDIYI